MCRRRIGALRRIFWRSYRGGIGMRRGSGDFEKLEAER
jgi:hypothetical protein